MGVSKCMWVWSKCPPPPPTSAVFVPFEYILIADEVYPVYLSLATGAFASVLFWRLHVCQRMSPSLAALNTCVHLGKLSLLIPPTSLHPSTLSLPLVPSIATTLILYPLLQTILFEPKRSISSPQLLVYSGLLLVGLFLSLDFILTPVLAAFTHRLPTTATLLGESGSCEHHMSVTSTRRVLHEHHVIDHMSTAEHHMSIT